MYLTKRQPQWLADMNPQEATEVARTALDPIEKGTSRLAGRHGNLINRVTQRGVSLDARSGLAEVVKLIITISHYAVQFGEGTFSMTRVFERIAKAENVFQYGEEALTLLRVIANKATWASRAKYMATHAPFELGHPLRLGQDAFGNKGAISNLAANTNTGGMGALTILATYPDQFATAASQAIPLIEQALAGHKRQYELAQQTTNSALGMFAEKLLASQYGAIRQANQDILAAQAQLQLNNRMLITQAGARGEMPANQLVTEEKQADAVTRLADAKERLFRAQAQFAARSYAVAGAGEAVMTQWELATVTHISLLSAIDMGMLVSYQGMREFAAIATALSQRANQKRWEIIAQLAQTWYEEDRVRAELQEQNLAAAYANPSAQTIKQLGLSRRPTMHLGHSTGGTK